MTLKSSCLRIPWVHLLGPAMPYPLISLWRWSRGPCPPADTVHFPVLKNKRPVELWKRFLGIFSRNFWQSHESFLIFNLCQGRISLIIKAHICMFHRRSFGELTLNWIPYSPFPCPSIKMKANMFLLLQQKYAFTIWNFKNADKQKEGNKNHP